MSLGDLGISTVNGGAIGVKNAIINGNFAVNQRAVSGTVTLAAGAYGHDRFKAGASGCTYTFATANNITTLTISAGSLIQVIEGNNLFTGTYTLSWVGTAQGKIGGGSYASSGVTGTPAGGSNLNIEFNTGTLSLVQFEPGAIATPFERRPFGQELALCQRYLPALRTTSEEALGGGYCPNTTLMDVLFSFQVPARVPTTGITTSAANTFLQQNGANAITGVSFLVGGATATYVRFTTSGVVALQANGVRSTGSSTFILFTGCEL
jgi:hypothetical protein